MHSLGVPTTRALCAVTSGETVFRQDGPEPGGVFTRVAESHLRVGTYQYFAFKNDIESIKVLLDYTVKRHYPELNDFTDRSAKAIELLKKLTNKQSDLIANWSALGFIHGVMNTDNFSMAGITIDYGPCAFMDEFKFEKVFSSIDQNGRYSFFNQVPIAKWNILRLAECLIPIIDKDQEKAISKIENEVVSSFDQFDHKRMKVFAKKIGIEEYKSSDNRLVMKFLTYLEKESIDMTIAFRELPKLYKEVSTLLPETDDLKDFKEEWKERVESIEKLNNINPIYIPRNHQIQKVINDAYEGNFSSFHQMLKVVTSPYKENEEFANYALGPKPHERVYQTFCGT